MILKGSQRGNGGDLAIHLMNGFDNERIEVAEVYGTVAGDLYGAFAEFEAVSLGTRAKEYLYSLSISPPEPLTREQYFEAIATIEQRLGLTDQPRAVVFHVKPDKAGRSREHCHVVWSRIDGETMRAVHMAHDRRKLMDVACELAHRFGLELPPGLKAWEEKRQLKGDKLEPTLAETAQEKASGITPQQRREEITAAYEAADSAEAFRAALEDKGYILARGDQRGYVVVDEDGGVHSLTRYVIGHKAAAIKAKLAALSPDQLPTVDQAKELAVQRARARQDAEQSRNDQAEAAREEQERLARRREREEGLEKQQSQRRLSVVKAEQEMLTRQQSERLLLEAAQLAESKGILFQARTAVADLIARTPGLRAVLGPLQKLTHLDPRERHRLERDALGRRHGREKLEIARGKRFLARIETRERRSMERVLRREQRIAEGAKLPQHKNEATRKRAAVKTRQDFHEVSRDRGLWKNREFLAGDLQEEFNNAASAGGDAESSGGDDGFAPDDDPLTDQDQDLELGPHAPSDDNTPESPKFRPRRKRGKGLRR